MADRDTVRLLIGDSSPAPAQLLTDEQLDALLVVEAGNVKLAAAQALDIVASSEALVSKKIRTQDGLSTDGPAVAAELRKNAKELRAQVQAARDDEAAELEAATEWAFDVVDTAPATGKPELSEWPSWGYS